MAPGKRKSYTSTINDGATSQPEAKKHRGPEDSLNSAVFDPTTPLSPKICDGTPNASTSKKAIQEPKTDSTVRKKPSLLKRSRKISKNQDWLDIPIWTRPDSPFMQLPVELLDTIVGGDSGLTVQDHLALSGTCKQIRAAYTKDVWVALYLSSHPLLWADTVAQANSSFINRLFSNALERRSNSSQLDSTDMEQPTRVQSSTEWRLIVVRAVNRGTTCDEAKKRYKVDDADLFVEYDTKLSMKATIRSIPAPKLFGKGSAGRHYRLAAVRALALKIHGGPINHERHLAKLKARAAKANARRRQGKRV